MELANTLSPWNSEAWLELAECSSGESEPEYLNCMAKALRYCTKEGDFRGLGEIYGLLAIHYAVLLEEQDRSMAAALFRVCERWGGDVRPLSYLFERCGLKPVGTYSEAAEVLRAKGFQVGFSNLVMGMPRS